MNETESTLYCRTEGSGSLVILLHGLLMDGNSWVSNGLVQALSGNFCVAYPDMLGHGMSDKPLDASLYDQDKQAARVASLIGQLGYKKAHIVGYSSGAWLAAGLVKYYPECISSLVIGGWDVANGLPEGPDGAMSFDMFFAYAKETAPALTGWITPSIEPAVRASFNAIGTYDGAHDSLRLKQINVAKLFWAGLDDIYYNPLNVWTKANKYTFLSATGDHVTAILQPAPTVAHEISEFIKKVEVV